MRQAFVSAGRSRIAFADTGFGVPLVLLHGNEADRSMFDALTPHLAPAFRVLAYDQRECGGTQGGDVPYALADLADDAAAFVRALGLGRAHVYGTSFGGLIAQALVARHPSVVDRLVLGNTWRAGRSPRDFNAANIARLAEYARDPGRHAADIARTFFSPAYVRDNPAVADMFRDNGRSREVRARRGAVMAETTPCDLAGFPRQVLLLTGSDDRVSPPAATAEILHHIPSACLITLDGVGHVTAVQAPGRLARTLTEFLLHAGDPAET